MIAEILNLIPPEFYKGVGMIFCASLPLTVAAMWGIAKKMARLQYDIDNIGCKLGTEKGIARAQTHTFLKEKDRRLKKRGYVNGSGT